MVRPTRIDAVDGESVDLIDQLIDDWQRERPDLDPSAMGVVGRVIHLAALLRSSAGEALKPYGLHYTDLDVLATLRRSGEPFRLTPTELGRSVLLTSGAMTAALGRLEKKGLLKRTTAARDRRMRVVVLTAAGRQLIDRAIATRFEEADVAVTGLTKKDRQSLAKLLRKLTVAARGR